MLANAQIFMPPRFRSWNDHFGCADFHREVSVSLLAQQPHLVPNLFNGTRRMLCSEVANPAEYLDQANIVFILCDSHTYVGTTHYKVFFFIDFPGVFDEALEFCYGASLHVVDNQNWFWFSACWVVSVVPAVPGR